MLREQKAFRIRSWVRRDSRRTPAQERAYRTLFPTFGLKVDEGMLDFAAAPPTFLEIGFGTGQSLLALAKANPTHHFIGIETHKPAIGALLMGIEADELTNLRVYHSDAIDVLNQCIPDGSLTALQLFFPDPWPKRRHHPRRIIQADFVAMVVKKLKPDGIFHLATDWEDYGVHMMRVLSANEDLINLAGKSQFADRSPLRPITTKFEKRAIREGRKIFELQFSRRDSNLQQQ